MSGIGLIYGGAKMETGIKKLKLSYKLTLGIVLLSLMGLVILFSVVKTTGYAGVSNIAYSVCLSYNKSHVARVGK